MTGHLTNRCKSSKEQSWQHMQASLLWILLLCSKGTDERGAGGKRRTEYKGRAQSSISVPKRLYVLVRVPARGHPGLLLKNPSHKKKSVFFLSWLVLGFKLQPGWGESHLTTSAPAGEKQTKGLSDTNFQ